MEATQPVSTELTENPPPSSPESPQGGPKRKVIKKRIPRKHRQEELEQPDEFMEVGGTLVDWLVDRYRIVVPLLGSREDASAALFDATAKLPDTESAFASTVSLSSLTGATEEDGNKDQEIRDAAQGLAQVGDEFAGTPQAGIAHIRAASALSRIPDYEGALTHFEAAESEGGVVGQTAKSGRAYTLASLERYDEALPIFDELIEASKGAMKQQLLVDRAKLHASKGDDARAQELYAAFVAEYPDSPLTPDIESRIESK
jgi:tetratricopeptide (TPR) repeat protein